MPFDLAIFAQFREFFIEPLDGGDESKEVFTVISLVKGTDDRVRGGLRGGDGGRRARRARDRGGSEEVGRVGVWVLGTEEIRRCSPELMHVCFRYIV